MLRRLLCLDRSRNKKLESFCISYDRYWIEFCKIFQIYNLNVAGGIANPWTSDLICTEVLLFVTKAGQTESESDK